MQIKINNSILELVKSDIGANLAAIIQSAFDAGVASGKAVAGK